MTDKKYCYSTNINTIDKAKKHFEKHLKKELLIKYDCELNWCISVYYGGHANIRLILDIGKHKVCVNNLERYIRSVFKHYFKKYKNVSLTIFLTKEVFNTDDENNNTGIEIEYN